MSATVSISANIPATLGEMLNKVSEAEERSKLLHQEGLREVLNGEVGRNGRLSRC